MRTAILAFVLAATGGLAGAFGCGDSVATSSSPTTPDPTDNEDASADAALNGNDAGTDAKPLPDGQTPTGSKVVEVALGHSHTCALVDDGRVKCWGRNQNGQLGLGDTNDRGKLPGEMGAALPSVSLGTGRKATAIAALDSLSCALLDDGTIKCWGQMRPLTGVDNLVGDAAGEMGDALQALPFRTR
jgi:hypothetical protein